MKIIDKKEVELRKRGKNDYNQLFKQISEVVKEKKSWIVEIAETEVYSVLGSKGRTHLSSKYGLAVQIGKELTGLFKTTVYCAFTSSVRKYYISNSSLK